MNLDNLRDIISSKQIQPTIINENSNFVVVTYWWGNKINNQNTSRPCISFFEKILNQVKDLCIKTLATSSPQINIQQIYNRLENIMSSLKSFTTIIDKTATSYNEMIYEHLGVTLNESNRDNVAITKLEKFKTLNKTPADYEYKDKEYAARMFMIIMIQAITITKSNMLKIYDTNTKIAELKASFLSRTERITSSDKDAYLKMIEQLNNILKTENAAIKKKLNTKQDYTNEQMKEFNGMSIYEILHKEFRFLSPMTYDEMIVKWEEECKKFGCNYMAVEYPEFAKPGGYQMAINAKPLFIRQALAACAERSVLYIDGDMFIRKYPSIFDMRDVDFMARGWWIDPRSSWKMEESITYDPYTFETSGGTMFFSQSTESKQLINAWIKTAGTPSQIGKADDRILSLVFNTYKFLCSMKVIQLPIEYLWLTLDYDERMLDIVYDYDKYKMQETIFIEHSECLTSEDTASGSGAASDRTPKFYGYLEENIEPVSEQFHEYIMFPSEDMVDTLKTYLDFMKGVQYISDGNVLLLKKGLISIDNPADNEQPLYITNYNDKFGNIKYPQDNSLTYNQVADINMKRATNMVVDNLELVNISENMIEINNFSHLMKEEDATKYNHAVIMSLIIKLLLEGKTVIYNPIGMTGYDGSYYDILKQNENTKYQSMEFIFSPEFTSGISHSSNYFYKPKMRINQAMMFKPNDILIKFLTMFLTLDDLSEHLNNGSYEFMSRVRVGYIIKKTQKKVDSVANMVDTNVTGAITNMIGGDVDNDEDIDRYSEGLDILYKGGRRTKNMNPKNMKPRKMNLNKMNPYKMNPYNMQNPTLLNHTFTKTKKLLNYININKVNTNAFKSIKHKSIKHKTSKHKTRKHKTRKHKDKKHKDKKHTTKKHKAKKHKTRKM